MFIATTLMMNTLAVLMIYMSVGLYNRMLLGRIRTDLSLYLRLRSIGFRFQGWRGCLRCGNILLFVFLIFFNLFDRIIFWFQQHVA